jgi:AcrR family transcriptional regulator
MDREAKSNQEKEQRILDAAQKLFARYGPKKTSIDEIAQNAGMGKGTIYLYFRSKEDIFAGVVRRFGEGMMLTVRAAVGSQTTAEAQLHNLILARLRYVDETIKQDAIPREVLLEFQDSVNSTALAPVIRVFAEQQIRLLRDIIETGMREENFETVDPDVTALAIYAVLESAGKPWACDGLTMTLESKVQTLVDLFLRGLLKRP